MYGRPSAFFRSERRQTTFSQEHQPLQVVACRLQMQDKANTDDAHAAHQFAAHLRQSAEHVFDAGARCDDAPFAFLLRFGNTLGGAAFAMNVDALSNSSIFAVKA